MNCNACGKDVMPVKSGFPHFWFWFTLIAFFPLAIVIWMLHMMKRPVNCPIASCKKNVYSG